jgi:hypothetical protein
VEVIFLDVEGVSPWSRHKLRGGYRRLLGEAREGVERMENIYVYESTAPTGIHADMDSDQATALAKAIHGWLTVKVATGTFDAGADMILQDFANDIEAIAKRG